MKQVSSIGLGLGTVFSVYALSRRLNRTVEVAPTRIEQIQVVAAAPAPPAKTPTAPKVGSDGALLFHLAALPGHRGQVIEYAFSKDGGHLLTSCNDGVRLWDLKTQQLVRHEPKAMRQVSFSGDGSLMRACGYQGEIK